MNSEDEQHQMEQNLYGIAVKINALNQELEALNYAYSRMLYDRDVISEAIEQVLDEMEEATAKLLIGMDDYKSKGKVIDMQIIKYYNAVKKVMKRL